MSIFNFLTRFKKETKIELRELEIGSFIEVSYKDPKSLGIISENTLTCTRLNQDEVINRKITGFITSKYFDDYLRIWFLGVRACKKNGNQIIERDFLFMENEIEKYKLLR